MTRESPQITQRFAVPFLALTYNWLRVSPCEEAIQYRKGTGTDTTHWRVGTQGMTCSTRCAAVWAMRRPAQDGQNPRRLQLKGTSNSCLQVSQPSRRKPCARIPHRKYSSNSRCTYAGKPVASGSSASEARKVSRCSAITV